MELSLTSLLFYIVCSIVKKKIMKVIEYLYLFAISNIKKKKMAYENHISIKN